MRGISGGKGEWRGYVERCMGSSLDIQRGNKRSPPGRRLDPSVGHMVDPKLECHHPAQGVQS